MVKNRVDQVQYLASMQSSSNSRYQYFSIDASRGTSYLFGQDTTAIHASGIINQAVFLNDALSAIQKLYNNQGNTIYEMNELKIQY